MGGQSGLLLTKVLADQLTFFSTRGGPPPHTHITTCPPSFRQLPTSLMKSSRHTIYTYLDTQHSYICSLDITNRSFHCIPTISYPLQQFLRIMCPLFFISSRLGWPQYYCISSHSPFCAPDCDHRALFPLPGYKGCGR